MKALLYHDGWYTVFYATHDPLDNAIPSLHVAIPFGIILLNWLHCKEKGIKMREWTHWPYHLFIVLNTILFIFTIAYLGIHWLIDIPFGIIIGGIGALFIHHLQPRMRNDHGRMFEGVTKKKVINHTFWEGAATLVILFFVLSAVSYQESNLDDRVSMRLGGGDSTYEILIPLENEQEVTTSITNLDNSLTLEFAILWVEESVDSMKDGVIDWSVIEEEYTVYSVAPGETKNVTVSDENLWHLVILHNAAKDVDDVIEVKIINDYGDNEMWKAIALSIPSMWMTGFVIHRIKRLKQAGRSFIDSTPSHLWEEE